MTKKEIRVKDTQINFVFNKNVEKYDIVFELKDKDEEELRFLFREKIRNFKKNNLLIFVSLKGNLKQTFLANIAKVISEEIVKLVLEDKSFNVQKIIFVFKNKNLYKIFSQIVSDHVGYINRKIGLYPIPTVDIIIEVKTKQKHGVVLIERKNPPYGWAIPGGFVEYNESLEDAAVREAKEETGLDIKNLKQFHTYSQPGRDPRFHTISTVFIAETNKLPKASSDAKKVVVATKEEILKDKYHLVFDHKKILLDYFESKIKNGKDVRGKI